MKTAIALIIAGLILSSAARAAEAPKEDLPALVKQLGDDNPKTRDQASAKLRKLGKEALPTLAEAQKNDDPEIASRAQAITRQIDEDLHPKPKADPTNRGATLRLNGLIGGNGIIVGGAGGGAMQIRIQTTTVMNGNGKSVSVTNNNGVEVRETTVTEADQTIKIREDADGIAVTTTQKKDGKDVSETVKAKDKDALKKENPKAYELFEKHAKAGDVRLNGGIGQITIEEDAKPAKEPAK